jgi:hypothetical protein
MSISQYAEHQAQARFVRNLQLLELELQMGSPRRHLDVLVELLTLLLPLCGPRNGSNLLVSGYRAELDAIKHRVVTRSNLRLVLQ